MDEWFLYCSSKVYCFSFSSFSGWISSLTGLNKSIPVGIMMIIIAALFTASAVISLVMFKKVSCLFHFSAFCVWPGICLRVAHSHKAGVDDVIFLGGLLCFCSIIYVTPMFNDFHIAKLLCPSDMSQKC